MKNSIGREILIVGGLYALSRVILLQVFDFDPIELCDWRTPAKAWLVQDFFSTIWYWHASPPLVPILKYVKSNSFLFMSLLHFACGLTLTAAIYFFVRSIVGLSFFGSACLALLFMLLPTVINFELSPNYDYLTATLVTLLVTCFVKAAMGPRPWPWVCGFSAVCTILPFLQSKFHLVWVVLCLGFMLVALGMRGEIRGPLWRYFAAVGVPTLAVAGLFVKNALVFGVLGASSWTGLHLSLLTHDPKYVSDVAGFEDKVGSGEFSPASAVTLNYGHAFHAFGATLGYPAKSPYMAKRLSLDERSVGEFYRGSHRFDHRSLQEPKSCPANTQFTEGLPNFNHVSIIPFSKDLMSDSLSIIRDDPMAYALRVSASAFAYLFVPSTERIPAVKHRDYTLEEIYEMLLFQPKAWGLASDSDPHRIEESFIDKLMSSLGDGMLIWGLIFISIHILLFLNLFNRRLGRYRLIFAFILFNFVYLGAVVNLINGKETARMRFYIEPLAYCMIVYFAAGASRTRAQSIETQPQRRRSG